MTIITAVDLTGKYTILHTVPDISLSQYATSCLHILRDMARHDVVDIVHSLGRNLTIEQSIN